MNTVAVLDKDHGMLSTSQLSGQLLRRKSVVVDGRAEPN